MADKRPFAVYRTVEVDIDVIVDRLGKGITGKESHHDLYHAHLPPLLSCTPSQVIEYHLTLPNRNQSLLLIADRADLPTHGLLVINLSFADRPDALRQKLYYASDFVPSVNIGEVSWSETLANATLPLYPRKRFALFADPGFHPRYLMKDALEKMNGGIGGRREGTGSVFAEWVNAPEGGLEEVVEFWRSERVEREWDGGYFVVVSQEAWDGGKAVLVSGGAGEGEVCEIEVELERVGEVLVWLFVGFLTWKEIRERNETG